MAYQIEILKTAQVDVREYVDYLRAEGHSPSLARRWLARFRLDVNSLKEEPNRFALIPESEELATEFRSMQTFSHRVIYFVKEKPKLVTVYRVYHGARRPLKRSDM